MLLSGPDLFSGRRPGILARVPHIGNVDRAAGLGRRIRIVAIRQWFAGHAGLLLHQVTDRGRLPALLLHHYFHHVRIFIFIHRPQYLRIVAT